MDAFEINKIVGWALFALLLVFGGRTFMDIYNGAHDGGHVEKSAYAIEVEEKTADTKSAEKEKPATVDIKTLLANANVVSGAKIAKKCAACHTFDKGGKNKLGPVLYDLVNRPLASVPGFAYSDGIKAKGGKWTYDNLAAFLKKPKDFIPGTKMVFSGIRNDSKLANLIAYLRNNSDNPAALP